MPELTGELRRIADDAVRQARPLAVADVVRRGDRKHRRAIIGRAVGALLATGALAAAILVVTALLPSSRAPSVQLAAWTVTKQADGDISVTIRELRDAAGLQRALRADGVPVSISFVGQWPRACVPYPYRPFQPQLFQPLQVEKVIPPGPPDVLVIHPSALPPGSGLQLARHFQYSHVPPLPAGQDLVAYTTIPSVTGSWPVPTLLHFLGFQRPGQGGFEVAAVLVRANPRCTGS